MCGRSWCRVGSSFPHIFPKPLPHAPFFLSSRKSTVLNGLHRLYMDKKTKHKFLIHSPNGLETQEWQVKLELGAERKPQICAIHVTDFAGNDPALLLVLLVFILPLPPQGPYLEIADSMLFGEKCVYLLVFDASQPEQARLDYWCEYVICLPPPSLFPSRCQFNHSPL